MDRKYQVFVSSTYEDLKKEREQIVKAVLEMGHIPVGMEMFSAADEQQWNLISRQISESDYYVVVIAHRYGSLDGDISYTEKEYDYAIKEGVPTLGFILNQDTKWNPNFIDKDPMTTAALDKFKVKVKQKLVNFWTSADDLHAKVALALMKQMAASPRQGWVRPNGAASPAISAELARLSLENSSLRTELQKAAAKQQDDKSVETRNLIRAMYKNKRDIPVWLHNAKDWTRTEHTLLDIFHLMAPQLMVERSVKETASFLGRLLSSNHLVRSEWPVPTNTMGTLFADLSVLGVCTPSTKTHLASDREDYWTLTPLGREVYALLRKADLMAGMEIQEANAAKPEVAPDPAPKVAPKPGPRAASGAREPKQPKPTREIG